MLEEEPKKHLRDLFKEALKDYEKEVETR